MSNKPKEEAHIEAFLAQLGAAPKTLEEIARGLGCTPRNAARYLALAKEKVPDRFVEEPGRRRRPATFAAAKTAPVPTSASTRMERSFQMVNGRPP